MSRNQLPMPLNYTRKKIQDYSYGLNDLIGKGYSSQVYKGRNDQSDGAVAVKVIDLKMLKNEINRTLLESEIDILKYLKDTPNILHLHEVYTTKNNTYIITQLCEGDLNTRIKKKMTEEQAYQYMGQLIKGYMQIYRKGIIHRDLKPANLLLTHNDELKIADFGFGIRSQDAQKPSKYNVGSPLYMAPESLKKNEYSFKTDLWSLGVIFFEMLATDTPWKAKNEKELINKIQNQKIDTILNKKQFSTYSKQFLSKVLCINKTQRMTPEQLNNYKFGNIIKSKNNNILGEKKLNSTLKTYKLDTLMNATITTSNKNPSAQIIGCSLEKKNTFNKDYSQKKINQIKCENHNYSINGNNQKNKLQQNYEIIKKQDKKHISKLLIAQVHFCRFLFKLLCRLIESKQKGIIKQFYQQEINHIFSSYTKIICHKIQKLRSFENNNFLNINYYQEYKNTSDYKKLMKIAKEYNDRYSTQLSKFWTSQGYCFEIDTTNELMQSLLKILENKINNSQNNTAIVEKYSKDIIILDYLMTSRQLLEMLIDGENYEKFTRKSRIEEIVQGTTTQITFQLYKRIVQRAQQLLGIENGNIKSKNQICN